MRRTIVIRNWRLACSMVIFVYLTFLGGTVYSDQNFALKVFHQGFTILFTGFWLFLMLWQRKGFPTTALDLPLLVLMGVRFASIFFGLNPRMSAEIFWRPLTHVVLFYALIWTFRASGWGHWFRALYLTGGVVVIIGLLEFFGWYTGLPILPVFQEGWLQIGGVSNLIPPAKWRLNFTLTNATALSSYLALLVPPALAMTIRANRKSRLGWSLWIAGAMVVQLLSRSRSGILALTASLSVFFLGFIFIYRDRVPKIIERLGGRKRIGVGLAVLLLCIILIGVFTIPVYAGRLGTVQIRFNLWSCALQMAVQRPFLGVGVGQFGRALRVCLNIPSTSYEQFTTAHNLYLNILAESGILGLAAFSWFLLVLVRASWRRYKCSASISERILVLGFVSALVGFGFNCLVDTMVYTPNVLPVLFFAVWIVYPYTPRPRKIRRLAPIAGAFVLLVGYGAFFAMIDRGEERFRRALVAFDHSETDRAMEEIDAAREIDPWLELYDFQKAYFLGVMAHEQPDRYLDRAIQSISAMLQIDNNYSLHHANLAALYWQRGDSERAIASMRRAIDTNPPNVDYWLNLGIMLEESGQYENAIQAYGICLAKEPEWAGSGFWKATSFRSQAWEQIESAAVQQGANRINIWNARGEIEKIVEAIPNPVSAFQYASLGRVKLVQEMPEDALEAFDEALARSPQSYNYYAWRAEAYWELGMAENASQDARTALFISPYSAARAHYTLGQIALASDDMKGAMDHFWRARSPRFAPQNWEVVLYNKRALFLPFPQLARITGGLDRVAPWLALAQLHIEQGERQKAASIYESLLQDDEYLKEVRLLLDKLDEGSENRD